MIPWQQFQKTLFKGLGSWKAALWCNTNYNMVIYFAIYKIINESETLTDQPPKMAYGIHHWAGMEFQKIIKNKNDQAETLPQVVMEKN